MPCSITKHLLLYFLLGQSYCNLADVSPYLSNYVFIDVAVNRNETVIEHSPLKMFNTLHINCVKLLSVSNLVDWCNYITMYVVWTIVAVNV